MHGNAIRLATPTFVHATHVSARASIRRVLVCTVIGQLWSWRSTVLKCQLMLGVLVLKHDHTMISVFMSKNFHVHI